MKFCYPKTITEASYLLREDNDAIPIAGGTDIAVLINNGAVHPLRFVDLTKLGLSYISNQEENISIGATTCIADILESPTVRKWLPVLTLAAEQLGSTQCRSIATIGGNLCSAVPSADTATPLLALNASVRLDSCEGTRIVPLDRFFLGPRKTVLKKGEILTEVQIPRPNQEEKGMFIKFGRRGAVTLSTVNVAAQVLAAGSANEIQIARIALGAVAPTPMRAYQAESFLQCRMPSLDIVQQAARISTTETAPISDQRASKQYRQDITLVLVQRALNEALGLS